MSGTDDIRTQPTIGERIKQLRSDVLMTQDDLAAAATEIRLQLAAACRIVLCDRYVTSSYVLQRIDAVPIEFIEALNAAADVPDLAVILTAHPAVTNPADPAAGRAQPLRGRHRHQPRRSRPLLRHHGSPGRTRLAAADNRHHPYPDRAGHRTDRWANRPPRQPPTG